jgi:hypothetical protein
MARPARETSGSRGETSYQEFTPFASDLSTDFNSGAMKRNSMKKEASLRPASFCRLRDLKILNRHHIFLFLRGDFVEFGDVLVCEFLHLIEAVFFVVLRDEFLFEHLF